MGLKGKSCLWLLSVILVCSGAAASAGATSGAGAGRPVKRGKPARQASHAAGKRAGAKASGKASARKRGAGKAAKPLTRAQLKAQQRRGARSPEVVGRAIRLNTAFVASATLRPMAQQLASTRSTAAFAAVNSYAASHPGDGAETAYLALGHAYSLDKRYGEAADSFRRSGNAGQPLSDYADYLGAQALVAAGRFGEVPPLLEHFGDRHPDSVFIPSAPMLLANAYSSANNPGAAVKVLEPLLGTPVAEHADFKLALGRAYQASGQAGKAIALFRSVYQNQPLTNEATQAALQLSSLGSGPSAAERKVHADQLFNAKRYSEASNEYGAIRNDPSLGQQDRDGLVIYSAVCQLKLKHLDRHDIDKLPATSDDTAALKLYLYAEISRTEKDRAGHDGYIAQMVDRYPHSRWLEEALYSGGNMYLLTRDAEQAIYHYKLLVERFPNSLYAPSAHWRDAWMNYRLRRYPEAARLMDEQVIRYGAGIEAPSALYWRARIYEEQDRDFAHAAAYYKSLDLNYTNFYYGVLARKRLTVLGAQAEVAPTAALTAVRKLEVPDLADAVPEDDPHVIKAKLLANAALNEFIAPEIAAGEDSAQWGALAQAQIYASYGEVTRALQSMKKSGISFFALPTSAVPRSYWTLIFPQPYWGDLVADSERNGLDPYLVASLIRQESEFNAGAVSPARAMGLMQLIAVTGKENAKKEGLKGFNAMQLLNPSVNLQLGTRNLRGVLDRFGGQPEYALAAYNAGDVPVRQWMAAGDYKDVAEFVESIPYTETREYVQAILRNRELYRMLYPVH